MRQEKQKKRIWKEMTENKPVKVNWRRNLIWDKSGPQAQSRHPNKTE